MRKPGSYGPITGERIYADRQEQFQIVVVNERWTYAWRADEFFLRPGDIVLLPPGRRGRSNWFGRVTGLSSDYEGKCKKIIDVYQRLPDTEVYIDE